MRLRQSRERDKERQAKRYAANSLLRLMTNAVSAKRYAEDPAVRQMKQARQAKRYAEDPAARQGRACARLVRYEKQMEAAERVAGACEQERVQTGE